MSVYKVGNMDKKLIIIGITLILISITLSGCTINKEEMTKFVGTWISEHQGYDYTIIFYSDGKYETINHIWGNGNYEVRDGQLILNQDNTNMVYTMDYIFSNDNQKFTLVYESGSQLEFTKINYIEPESNVENASVVVSGTSHRIKILLSKVGENSPYIDVSGDSGFDIWLNGTKLSHDLWDVGDSWEQGESIILTSNENNQPLVSGNEYSLTIIIMGWVIYDAYITVLS